jgi:hypothetical protein
MASLNKEKISLSGIEVEIPVIATDRRSLKSWKSSPTAKRSTASNSSTQRAIWVKWTGCRSTKRSGPRQSGRCAARATGTRSTGLILMHLGRIVTTTVRRISILQWAGNCCS